MVGTQTLQHKLKAEAEQRIDEAHVALQSHLHSSDGAQDKQKEAERQRRALERRLSEVWHVRSSPCYLRFVDFQSSK